MHRLVLGWLLVTLAVGHHVGHGKLDLLYKWRSVDFKFESQRAREAAIQDGSFVPGNNVPLDVDFWEYEGKRKLFMTIPRFQKGTPASLVTVSDQKNSEGHLLEPYPRDWSWHKEGHCDGVTSAFRTQIDQCGRLWVIDSGISFTNPKYRICQPQLLAFDLRTDRLAGRHRFSDSIIGARSVLTTVAVDVRDPHDKCHDTHVYVSDVTGFAMLVFDARKNKSWKVSSNTFYPYPPQGVFRTNNVEFDLMDGVIGLALSPMTRGEKSLYYHSFASLRESWVSTAVLKNESLFKADGSSSVPRKFKMSEEARPSQAAAEVFDHNGNLFFAPVTQNSLMCWNSGTPYTSSNLHTLVHDDTNLQFLTGIKIHTDAEGNEDLYIVTDKFHLVMVGKMNPKEVNIRIVRGRVADLVKGSGCVQDRSKPTNGFTLPQRPSAGYGTFGG